MNIPQTIDVIVVGLGPVGAALGNLLGRFGVHTLVIDKSQQIFMAPRAIALDNEALRVLQMCGLEEGDIDLVAIPEVRMHSPVFGAYSKAVTAGALDGHPRLVTFYQPQLEAVLRRRLSTHSSVRVELGVELVDFRQHGDHVEATLRDCEGSQHTVRARYLVGADGANSLVRQRLGQDFKGKTYAEDWLVVDALKVPRPIDHVEFICDPLRPTPHMVAPGNRQRWEFKLRPGETRQEMEHPDTVRRLLRPWTQGEEIAIERVAVYRFHARVAQTFQVGRAFLVGDAAHVTPPFVGQGLVAGLRDVANLGWKLAWVVERKAREDLLDSYTTERRPHAQAMIRLAQMMGRLVMPSNTAAAFVIHGGMKLLSHIPKLRKLVENLEIKPANRFKRGCFADRERGARFYRGGPLPQAWLRGEAGLGLKLSDDALGLGFAAVGFGVDPSQGLSDELIRRWQAAGGSFVRIDPRGSLAQCRSRVWEDVCGALIPSAAPTRWVAIVRPDKVVMHDGPANTCPRMVEEALRLFAENPVKRQDTLDDLSVAGQKVSA